MSAIVAIRSGGDAEGDVQHRCEMKALISSGDEKITSARSPIIPAATRAGAPLWDRHR
jgi:hypothetical protein